MNAKYARSTPDGSTHIPVVPTLTTGTVVSILSFMGTVTGHRRR